MKASEYIAKMQALIDAHGDLELAADSDLGLQEVVDPHLEVVVARDAITEADFVERPLEAGTEVMVIG